MEQRTGSKLGKKHIKAVYCHPVYLISMQSLSCEQVSPELQVDSLPTELSGKPDNLDTHYQIDYW